MKKKSRPKSKKSRSNQKERFKAKKLREILEEGSNKSEPTVLLSGVRVGPNYRIGPGSHLLFDYDQLIGPGILEQVIKNLPKIDF